jgi:hypothetical protein
MPVESIRRQPLHPKWMATPVRDAASLHWIGKLMGNAGFALGAALPAGFACRLDEQPDHLVPQYCLRQQAEAYSSNRLLFCAEPGAEPTGFERGLALDSAEAIFLVEDPASRMVLPFSIGADWVQQLDRALEQGLDLRSLPQPMRHSLLGAGVLAPPDRLASRIHEWNIAVERGTREFRQKGYVPLRYLIHPFYVSSLRRRYRRLVRTGKVKFGDGQCTRRYFIHNEPAAAFFHHQLTYTVSAFAGQAVQPSYVYVACYQEGAHLEKHTDREQCKFSVSLCIDYAPEPRIATAWPLTLHFDSNVVNIFQAIGDGLLYRGCEIPHSRDILPAGHTSTSIFFHYVPENFKGPLN